MSDLSSCFRISENKDIESMSRLTISNKQVHEIIFTTN